MASNMFQICCRLILKAKSLFGMLALRFGRMKGFY